MNALSTESVDILIESTATHVKTIAKLFDIKDMDDKDPIILISFLMKHYYSTHCQEFFHEVRTDFDTHKKMVMAATDKKLKEIEETELNARKSFSALEDEMKEKISLLEGKIIDTTNTAGDQLAERAEAISYNFNQNVIDTQNRSNKAGKLQYFLFVSSICMLLISSIILAVAMGIL
jgi:hypothetical protein